MEFIVMYFLFYIFFCDIYIIHFKHLKISILKGVEINQIFVNI